MGEIGSIAEASLAVTRIFEEAQLAANIYLEQVQKVTHKQSDNCEIGEQMRMATNKNKDYVTISDLPSISIMSEELDKIRYKERYLETLKILFSRLLLSLHLQY